MKLTSLIHTEQEPLSLAGSVSITREQIIAAHGPVTPIYGADGNLVNLEIDSKASVVDIIAILNSCGVPATAITSLVDLGMNTGKRLYTYQEDPQIGEGVITLIPFPPITRP